MGGAGANEVSGVPPDLCSLELERFIKNIFKKK